MELQQLLCKNCCGELDRLSDTEYKCPYCNSIFEEQSAKEYNEELRDVLDEAKLEAVSNARRNLYDAVTAEYISSVQVHECCAHLKQLLPDDFQARFYETAIGENARETAHMIRKIDVEAESCYVETMIGFLIASLKLKYVPEVGDLIERTYKYTDLVKFREYSTRLSVEAEKLDNCIYLTTCPRNVFVAYSSRDMEKVLELVECLEEQGLSCFLAARNLRHGAGSVENYKTALREAMDNCQSFVFVSSMNSRNSECDALRQEIPYIRRTDVENAPAELRNNYQSIPQKYKKHRVEYRLEESRRPVAADRIVSEFFAGYERVYSPMDVAERVLNSSISFDEERATNEPAPTPVASVKYCIACKGECPPDAKFCMQCGGSEFAGTLAEIDLLQRIAALEKEKAEFEKRKAEEFEQKKAIDQKEHPTPVPSPEVKYCAGCRNENPIDAKLCMYCGGTTFARSFSEVDLLQRVSSLEEKNKELEQQKTELQNKSTVAEKNANESAAFTKNTTPSEGLRFDLNIDEKSYSLAGFGTCKDREIVIPKIYDGKPVTRIGNYAFFKNTDIISVVIPDSITRIENNAFSKCQNLKDIQFEVSNGWRVNNKKIQKKTLSDPQLAAEALTITYENEFIVREKEFSRVSKGLEFEFYEDEHSYHVSAIGTCKDSKIVIPTEYRGKPVTEIDDSAFSSTDITSVIIPPGVEAIGSEAFADCENLISIEIPSSVTVIEEDAFSCCENLMDINVDINNPEYCSYMGDLYSKDGWTLLQYAIGKQESNFTIPNHVKTIRKNAFWGSLLTSVLIQSNVEEIDEEAFGGCFDIKEINVDSKNSKYCSVFGDLYSKDKTIFIQYARGKEDKKFILPNTVTTIGSYAFSNCENLTSVTLSSNVTTIGANAFLYCENLMDINVDINNPKYCSISGNLYSKDGTALLQCAPGKSNNVLLPDGVTVIKNKAFNSCTKITDVILSSSVTIIEENAFSWCENLISIEIPSSVTTIGKNAFSWCENLTSIEIPSSVTTISEDVFYRCKNLTNITIPSSVTTIGESAFSWCENLASIEIPSSVTIIAGDAFLKCDSLKSVQFETPSGWRMERFRSVVEISENLFSDSQSAAKTLREIPSLTTLKRT